MMKVGGLFCGIWLAWGLVWGWLFPTPAQEPVRIIWLHHSVGQGLIDQGSVREGLTALGYEFYDHGYNGDGLRLADGSYSGRNFDVPGDNTDPDGLAEIFRQPLHDPPDNTFSHLMQYDVIIIKSCFPTSNIGSGEQLAEYQGYYLAMRARMAQYPDKLFVVVTQPPQVPGSSDPDEARRARALADWLNSGQFLGGQPNIVTFDFFGHLAGEDNFLRPEYRYDDYDAHPNERANREIGPRFVEFLDQAIRSFAPGAAAQPTFVLPPTAEAPPPEATPTPPAPSALSVAASRGLDLGGWVVSDDDPGSTATCALDETGALRFDYQLAATGWAFCGQPFDVPQDWSDAPGLSFRVRGDPPGQRVILALFAGRPEAAAPYELTLDVPQVWTPVAVPWADFALATWADEGDPATPDLARVVGVGLSVEAEGNPGKGVLWVDHLSLGVSATPPSPSAATTAPDLAETPVQTEPAASEPGPSDGGLCPLAMAAPLGLVGVVLALNRRSSS